MARRVCSLTVIAVAVLLAGSAAAYAQSLSPISLPLR